MTQFILRKGPSRLSVLSTVLTMLNTLRDDQEFVLTLEKYEKRHRTAEQNRLMWAMLTDISQQVMWPVNGVMQALSPEEWKDLLTASLTSEMRVAQGIDGGIVLLGRRTSKMTVRQMTDLVDLMSAFGSERGVKFTASEGAA